MFLNKGDLISGDAGHNCSPDIGANGYKLEDNLTKEVWILIKEKLNSKGYLTKDCTPWNSNLNSVNESLSFRVKEANNSGSKLHLCIHFNAGGGTGVECFISGNKDIEKEIATNICNKISNLGYANRGVKTANLYVPKYTSMPCVLVECSFVDSKQDMDKYNANDISEAIVAAITNSVTETASCLQLNVKTSFSYSTNAIVEGDFLYVRDSMGAIIPGRQVDIGDRITVLDVGYTKQLALVQYQAGDVVRQGYVTNVPSIIKYDNQYNWCNGSTTETVYDEKGGNLGSLSPYERATILYKKGNQTHVVYDTDKGHHTKSGYVNFVGNAIPPSVTIPTVNEPNVRKEVYGLSGKGRPLEVYKVGSGNKILFAGFGIHGFEDNWSRDGVALATIATELLKELAAIDRNQGLNGWTVCVAPCMNPDGLLDGWTNNGPGRCAISTSIDLNRCFPAGFSVDTRSRYYTGNKSLLPPEAQGLVSCIQDLKNKSSRMVLLDCHGWLNQTLGNPTIGKFFGDQFGFGHNPSYGGGYFSTWANSIGIDSILLEYPSVSSTQEAINKGFVTKTLNGIKGILSLSSSSDGSTGSTETPMNRSGQVINVTSNLNVRSDASTSASIIGSLKSGEFVNTVAQKGDWYKIFYGTGFGYVHKDYIKIFNDNVDSQSNYELIVVSTSEGDEGRFKYNFIETAIKQIKDFKQSYNTDKFLITWIINKQNYSNTDIVNFIKTAGKIGGVSIQFIDSTQQFINYINTQSIDGSKKRTLKIKQFVVFGHGHPGEINLGIDYKITKDDLSNINGKSFDIKNKTYLYSCNAATGDSNSFAAAWYNLTQGNVTACVNKTSYVYITMDQYNLLQHKVVEALRIATGYVEDGAFNYPTPSETDKGYWMIYIGKNL